MNSKEELEFDVLAAAGEYGIGSLLFRNALAKKLGLNLTESACLTLLGIREASTPTELARYTGLTTGATTALLDRLEKRGFIRRRPNPADRRGVIIEFDERYTRTARKLVAGIQRAHRELVAQYSEQELAVIAGFLRGFTGNMRLHAKKIEEEDL